jgi:hypothetical protein
MCDYRLPRSTIINPASASSRFTINRYSVPNITSLLMIQISKRRYMCSWHCLIWAISRCRVEQLNKSTDVLDQVTLTLTEEFDYTSYCHPTSHLYSPPHCHLDHDARHRSRHQPSVKRPDRPSTTPHPGRYPSNPHSGRLW